MRTIIGIKKKITEKVLTKLGSTKIIFIDCYGCNYHIFKLFWEAPVGSILITKHEVDPQSLIHDKFVITLMNTDLVTVCHIPEFMPRLRYFFHKHDGHLKHNIISFKKYSKDLEQGWPENPARLTISNAITE